MNSLHNVKYDDMEFFVLKHSDYTLRHQGTIRKTLKDIETEKETQYTSKGVTFNIIKHTDNTYDAAIAEDRTHLTEEELEELYNTMYSAMIERNDEDPRLDSFGVGEFRGIFIKKMQKQYLEDEEEMSFYNYVEDEIYHVVCYE